MIEMVYSNKGEREQKPFDIEEIIREERILTYFQPIVSTYQDKVAGLEALSRGVDNDGEVISPIVLFEAARAADRVIELDQLCQKKAIENFSKRFGGQSGIILFINVDNSVIQKQSELIYDYALKYNLSPYRIVLEINELQCEDDMGLEDVREFADLYRSKGFMISIDDIGSGFSNLDRVIALEPDIIKIDREMITDIHKAYFKQQVVDMIIKLADRTGALVVAEGVENIQDILTVLRYGAHLLQGFYISKPSLLTVNELVSIDQTIEQICKKQEIYLSDFLAGKCEDNASLRQIFNEIHDKLLDWEINYIEDGLSSVLEDYPQVECGYIIDMDGTQISGTIFGPKYSLDTCSGKTIFTPYKKGDNAKLKAYYYVLKTTNQDLYISEPYLSLATGSKCLTVSGYYTRYNRSYILCLDMVL